MSQSDPPPMTDSQSTAITAQTGPTTVHSTVPTARSRGRMASPVARAWPAGSPPIPTDPDPEADVDRVEGFGRRYGVHVELLPFAYRARSPIEVALAVDEWIRDLPKTAATFRRHDIAKPVECHGRTGLGDDRLLARGVLPNTILYLCGAWQLDNREGGHASLWANPHYVHAESMAAVPLDARREWIRRTVALGLRWHEIAPATGLTRGGLTAWCTRNNLPLAGWRAEGYDALARTWKTCRKWGASTADLARIWNRTQRSVNQQIAKRAAEFHPPPDPSGRPPFIPDEER